MEKDLSVFAERFSQIIDGESQTSVAEKIYSNQGNISKLVNNKSDASLTVTNLIRISKIYNVSIDWLLGLDDSKMMDVIEPDESLPYTQLFCILANLYDHRAITGSVKESDGGEYEHKVDMLIDLKINDPVLKEMLIEIINNRGTDLSIFETWLAKYLVYFKGISIPYWDPEDEMKTDFNVADFTGQLNTLVDYANVIKSVIGLDNENKTDKTDK